MVLPHIDVEKLRVGACAQVPGCLGAQVPVCPGAQVPGCVVTCALTRPAQLLHLGTLTLRGSGRFWGGWPVCTAVPLLLQTGASPAVRVSLGPATGAGIARV